MQTSVTRPIPEYILSDPKRLRQILTNVIGNAIKFTDNGQVTVGVKFMAIPSGPNLSFSVADTGCGIPTDAHQKLFAPFVQADSSTTRRYGGTGLGLALSRHLARLLGGDLVLSASSPGMGSTFTVTIRADQAEAVVADKAGDHVGSGRLRHLVDEQLILQGVRVLVVEDHEGNRELVSKLLVSRGAQVDVAANGSEALVMARSQRFDIILMDIQMPLMDGYQATAALRAEDCLVPIVALTAHAMDDERARCLQTGFTDFLTKPIDIQVLLQTVQRYAPGSQKLNSWDRPGTVSPR